MKTNVLKSSKLLLIFAIALQLGAISCTGQTPNTGKEKTLSTNKPDVRYKVDKEYDPQGNLIRYDSSYSYSSAGPIVKDSVFNLFRSHFADPFSTQFFDTYDGFAKDTLFHDNERPFDSNFKDDEHFRKMMEELHKMEHYNERYWYHDRPQKRKVTESEQHKGTGV